MLTLRGEHLGLSMVKVSLKNNPDVFDVFPVSVSSVITPLSPVYVHIGGEV